MRVMIQFKKIQLKRHYPVGGNATNLILIIFNVFPRQKRTGQVQEDLFLQENVR